jgi:hypothetical protein
VGCAVGRRIQTRARNTSVRGAGLRGAVCHCLPAFLPRSRSILFLSLSLSLGAGGYLYPSQPGRVSTQQVREKQGRRRREAVGPPPSLIDCSCVRIHVPGFSSHGSVSRVESLRCLPEKDHIRQRFVSSPYFFAYVCDCGRVSFHSDVLPGTRQEVPACIDRLPSFREHPPSLDLLLRSIHQTSTGRSSREGWLPSFHLLLCLCYRCCA